MRLPSSAAFLSLALMSLQAWGQASLKDCCNVVSVDAARGVVTAEVTATGRRFAFAVENGTLLRALRPGMRFDARGAPGGTRFSLMNVQNVRPDWADNCCNLVGEAASLGPQNAALPAQATLDSRFPSIDPEHGARPVQPLADGVTFELLELRRVAENLVHMGSAIDNRTSETVDARRWGIFNWVGSGPTKQANGIRVQDMASGEAYRARNASQGMLDVDPAGRREYWAQYEVPPGVTSVAVLISDAPPLYDVAIDPRDTTSR